MLHSMQERGHNIARLSASFWEILEINSFFKNTNYFLSMSCSNNINPWTTSIQSLKLLLDRNYYLRAPLWFLTETEIGKYGTQSTGRWAHGSQLKVRGQLETVEWDQSRVCFLEAEISISNMLHSPFLQLWIFPKLKKEREGGRRNRPETEERF